MADQAGVISTAKQPEAPARAKSIDRIPTLDAARFLAAVAIVWLHAPEVPLLERTGDPFTRWAVPFFTAAAVFLLIRGLMRNPDRSFNQYVTSRALRLYAPFLAWTLVYFALRQAKRAVLSGEPPVRIDETVLFMGMAHHQWFLPFIFLLSVALFPVGRCLATHPTARSPAMAIATLLGAALVFVRNALDFSQDPPGLDHYRMFLLLSLDALPAGIWAIVVALYTHDRDVPSRAFASIGIVATLAGAVAIALLGRNALAENTAGIGVLFASLAFRWPGREQTATRLGALAYGMYLSHIAFIFGIQAIAHRIVVGPRWWLDVAVFVASVTGSILLTLALQQLKRTRWLVPA